MLEVPLIKEYQSTNSDNLSTTTKKKKKVLEASVKKSSSSGILNINREARKHYKKYAELIHKLSGLFNRK